MAADTAYAFAYALSTVGAIALAAVVVRRRSRDTVVAALAVYLLANAAWSAVMLVGSLVPPSDFRVVTPFVVPVVAVVVAAAVVLLRAVADRTWRPGRRVLVLLAVHPVVMIVAGATDVWHHGILTETADGYAFGWLFWVHTGVSYSLLAAAIGRLWRQRRSASALQRRRISTLLLAGLFPVLGNVVTLTVTGPDARDLTPVFFMVSAAVVTYAVFWQGLIDVLPVARNRVLEILGDPVIVLDELDRVADLNAAARGLLAVGGAAGDVVGQPAATALGPFAPLLLTRQGETRVVVGGVEMTLDVRTTELESSDVGGTERPVGRVVVARDVTEEIGRRDALAEANAVLQMQLVTIERLRAEVTERAVRDAMTGLHNRRYLDEVFPRLLAEQDLARPTLSVVLVDVDHFKAVNDEHGHAVGDRMLVAVGEALAAGLRPGGVVVRYGGEEFVALLPDTPAEQAAARAEELRRQCARATVSVRGGDLDVTASAGVATASPSRCTPSALLDAADAALYRAKRAGRDRTVVADPGAPAGPRDGSGRRSAGPAVPGAPERPAPAPPGRGRALDGVPMLQVAPLDPVDARRLMRQTPRVSPSERASERASSDG